MNEKSTYFIFPPSSSFVTILFHMYIVVPPTPPHSKCQNVFNEDQPKISQGLQGLHIVFLEAFWTFRITDQQTNISLCFACSIGHVTEVISGASMSFHELTIRKNIHMVSLMAVSPRKEKCTNSELVLTTALYRGRGFFSD